MRRLIFLPVLGFLLWYVLICCMNRNCASRMLSKAHQFHAFHGMEPLRAIFGIIYCMRQIDNLIYCGIRRAPMILITVTHPCPVLSACRPPTVILLDGLASCYSFYLLPFVFLLLN